MATAPTTLSTQERPLRWSDEVWFAVNIYGDKVIETGGASRNDLAQDCYAAILDYESRHAGVSLQSSQDVRNLLRSRISALYRYHKRREAVSLDQEHEISKTSVTLKSASLLQDTSLPDPLASLQQHERISLFDAAFASLSAIERRTIALYYFSGEPAPTINMVATVLGEEVTTVKKRLARAKDKLRTSLVSNYNRELLMDVPIADDRTQNTLWWYPHNEQSGRIVDRSYFASIPKQNHRLSRIYDDLRDILVKRWAALSGGTVPAPDDFMGAPVLECSEPVSVSQSDIRTPCANPDCTNQIILFPLRTQCTLCELLEKLGIGKTCPFCLTEQATDIRRRLCQHCVARPEIWRDKWISEWQKRRQSNRFRAFRRWDYGARTFKEHWCFDLTKDGLANTLKSAIYREIHETPRVTLFAYRDQPQFVFTDVVPQTISRRITHAPEIPGDIVHARETHAATLSADDRQHRQRQVMHSWQKRARDKFDAFKSAHKDLSRADALSLFATAFPADANLCTQHLCRRCGSFAGTKDFICTECKS